MTDNQRATADSPTGFDPICCYEELRFNLLEDPLYSSRSKYVLQQQGMRGWLRNIERFTSPLAPEEAAMDRDSLLSLGAVESQGGVTNRLTLMLADIIVAIYAGGTM